MQDAQATRRLAAVLFADMVGYSTLTSQDEELAIRMVRIFEQVSRQTAEAEGGRVVKFIGDAVLSEFPHSAAAANAAIALQEEFQKESEAAGMRRILRIGLHMGDVAPSPDGDLFGEGVNLAARLEQACTPGEVLASDVFYRQLRARKEFEFVTRGTRELKGFKEPEPVWALGRPGTVAEAPPEPKAKGAGVKALAGRVPRQAVWIATAVFVTLAGVGGYARLGPGLSGGGEIRGVAVLPFEDLTPTGDQKYFTHGVAEELLAGLSKVEGLRVPAWASSRQFEADADPEEVARKLGVDHILTGSIRKDEDSVWIRANLINVKDITSAWSQMFPRQLTDIFAVQNEIARAITSELQMTLAGGEQGASLIDQGTENVQAYETFLQGRLAWNERDAESLERAALLFERAAEIDPNFGRALAAAAETYVLLPEYAEADPEEMFEKARMAATRALEIDSTLAEAYVALGKMHSVLRDWRDAEENFRRGVELNPNYASAHQQFAWHLVSAGKVTEAVAEMKKAAELDPANRIFSENVGYLLYLDRRYDEAIAAEQKTLESHKDFHVALVGLARAQLAKGDCPAALATTERLKQTQTTLGAYHLGEIAHVYAGCNRETEARTLLAQAEAGSPGTYPALMALAHIKLGQKDEALTLLEIAVASKDVFVQYIIPSDPALDPIRDEQRFQSLLRILGLDPNAGRPTVTAGFSRR